MIMLGAVTLVVLLAAAVLIVPRLIQDAQPVGEILTPAETDYSMADGKALGPRDARVVIQEFSDFQCPGCKAFASDAGRRIKDEYIKTGRSVRFEYYHYTVVDSIVGGNESRNAARAADCAAEQGQFWRYHDFLFANVQGEGVGSFRDARLRAMAEAAGLNVGAFNACYDSGRTASSVDADLNKARGLGITGTPSVFVNGQPVQPSYDQIKARIDQLLAAP